MLCRIRAVSSFVGGPMQDSVWGPLICQTTMGRVLKIRYVNVIYRRGPYLHLIEITQPFCGDECIVLCISSLVYMRREVELCSFHQTPLPEEKEML